MSNSISTTASAQPTCFVVMGFGKKTDFETGRVLDLDTSYRNLIKPAVEAAGLKCFRADEIVHSGLIDVPMYEQLLKADVVVADLSTSNRNAIYEVGVRHALRPYTTVIIAEDGIMKSPFFDLSHIVIRTYRHLGEDIGVNEMRRFTAELTAAIQEVQKREPKLRWDSPVYKFIERLTPPSIAKEDAASDPPSSAPSDEPHRGLALAESTKAKPQPDHTVTTTEGGEAYSEMMRRVDEAQKKGKAGWLKAKMLLEEMREQRKTQIAKLSRERQTAKAEEPYLLQRLALATYKSEYPNAEEALNEARDLLALLEPQTSNDSETLGLLQAVHKRLWSLTKDRLHLDKAIWSSEKGFYLKNDYYNGINLAYLYNVRASISEGADAVTDFVLAQRTRRRVVDICQALLEKTKTEDAAKRFDDVATYWVLVTLAEAWTGLGDEAKSQEYQNQALALYPPPAQWMIESTQEQFKSLRELLAKSPLKLT